MIYGVSTACLYPIVTEKSLYELAVNGVKNIEIFFNSDSEMKSPYITEIYKIIKDFNLNVTSIHPYSCSIEPMMFFTDYPRRFDDILETYKVYFEIMNNVNAEYLIFHGNKDANSFPKQRVFERFARFQECAKSFGVTVLQENIARCSAAHLSYLKEMKSQLGDLAKFVLDTKQARRANEDCFNIIQTLGDSIKHIHFSDGGKNGDCLPYGEGDFDCDRFTKMLVEVGYNGALILELYSNSYTGGGKRLAENCRFMEESQNAIMRKICGNN